MSTMMRRPFVLNFLAGCMDLKEGLTELQKHYKLTTLKMKSVDWNEVTNMLTRVLIKKKLVVI